MDRLTGKKEMKEVPLSEVLIERPPKRFPFNGLKVGLALALVCSLAALGGGGYLFTSMQVQQREQASLEADQVQVSERVKALEDQVNKLRSDSERIQQDLQSLAGTDAEIGEGFEEFRLAFDDLGSRMSAIEASDQGLAAAVQKLREELAALRASSRR
jgi:cell division protein FtsB